MRNLAITLPALYLVACAPALKFTAAGTTTRPAKPPTCDFTVLADAPAEAHEELGTIDIRYDGRTDFINDTETLKRRLRRQVCSVGGDAVVGHANSYGTYLKATVLSLTPAQPAAPTAGAPDAAGGDKVEAGAAAEL